MQTLIAMHPLPNVGDILLHTSFERCCGIFNVRVLATLRISGFRQIQGLGTQSTPQKLR